MSRVSRWTVCALLALSGGCARDKAPQAAAEQLPEALQSVLDKAEHDPAFAGADVALAMRGAKLQEIVNSINTIPDANRQLAIQVLRENRKLADNGNYYLELYDLPDNKATGSLQQITATWEQAGALAIDARLAVAGSAKVHGHYKPANTGGHVGLNVQAGTGIRGHLAFVPDTNALFAVTFTLDPAAVSYSLASSLKDKKDMCWRIEYPCIGTWRDPVRTCEGRDCKTLWDYEIPISISDTIRIAGTMIRMPVQVGMPEEFRIDKRIGKVEFKRSASWVIKPTGFTADARGLFVKAAVTIVPSSTSSAPAPQRPAPALTMR